MYPHTYGELFPMIAARNLPKILICKHRYSLKKIIHAL